MFLWLNVGWAGRSKRKEKKERGGGTKLWAWRVVCGHTLQHFIYMCVVNSLRWVAPICPPTSSETWTHTQHEAITTHCCIGCCSDMPMLLPAYLIFIEHSFLQFSERMTQSKLLELQPCNASNQNLSLVDQTWFDQNFNSVLCPSVQSFILLQCQSGHVRTEVSSKLRPITNSVMCQIKTTVQNRIRIVVRFVSTVSNWNFFGIVSNCSLLSDQNFSSILRVQSELFWHCVRL